MKQLRIAVLVLLLGAGLVSVSPGLSQIAGTVVYFSDPTFGLEVGTWTKTCSGQNFHTGQTTIYYKFEMDGNCGTNGPCRAGETFTTLYDLDNSAIYHGCISTGTCRDAGNFCQPDPQHPGHQVCYHCG
jgi:hypothetical protein